MAGVEVWTDPGEIWPRRIADRLVVHPCGCWLWTGATISGAPSISWMGRSQLGIRVLYELIYGPIPLGARVRHRCDQVACLNPAHVYLDDQSTPEGRRAAFLEMVTPRIRVLENGCWEWMGSTNRWGYAIVENTADNPSHRLHRIVYEMVCGPVPDGLVLDHLCRMKSCVNPQHLEAVTVKENTLRGESPYAVNARKTHCPQDHPYDEANTRYKRSRGHIERVCKTCANVERRERRRRNREAIQSRA